MLLLGYFYIGAGPAACLIENGKLISFIEEERLIRIKHANNRFPINAIKYCLNNNGLKPNDIDYFCFGWDAHAYTNGQMQDFYNTINQDHAPDQATLQWQESNLKTFSKYNLEQTLSNELYRAFGQKIQPKLEFYPHHKSHAAAAYYLSEFDDALILSIDGSGDSQTTTIWHGKGLELELLHETNIPHSLGWFYAAMTEFLGFKAYDGEYKVMGLAAYGQENLAIRAALEKVVLFDEAKLGFLLNMKYIHHGAHTYSTRFTDDLVKLLGLEPRLSFQPVEKIHKDIAYETQLLLEKHVAHLLAFYRKKTGVKNICISGGVGSNIKMIGHIHQLHLFDHIFPFPIPSDSGTAIGAALGIYVDKTKQRPQALENVYLGPSFSNEDIERELISCKILFEKSKNVALDAARLLADGNVIGWFQHRMEGGPRALGARSILADPRNTDSGDRVNEAIKFRELWRPFCPSMLADEANNYLINSFDSKYMTISFLAKDRMKKEAPAVVHIDGTARVQMVSEKENKPYHDLIKNFQELTGVPIILNTSFNVKGEPIVCTPKDALRTFFTTGLDALFIGDFLVRKIAAA